MPAGTAHRTLDYRGSAPSPTRDVFGQTGMVGARASGGRNTIPGTSLDAEGGRAGSSVGRPGLGPDDEGFSYPSEFGPGISPTVRTKKT